MKIDKYKNLYIYHKKLFFFNMSKVHKHSSFKNIRSMHYENSLK